MAEVAFRSAHNSYLAILEGHLAAEGHVTGHSTFTLTKHHHQFTLKNHHGRRRGNLRLAACVCATACVGLASHGAALHCSV